MFTPMSIQGLSKLAAHIMARPYIAKSYVDGTTSAGKNFEKASLEWCRGNSKKWENPVREKHYSLFC
jgi:hypothetical protein